MTFRNLISFIRGAISEFLHPGTLFLNGHEVTHNNGVIMAIDGIPFRLDTFTNRLYHRDGSHCDADQWLYSQPIWWSTK